MGEAPSEETSRSRVVARITSGHKAAARDRGGSPGPNASWTVRLRMRTKLSGICDLGPSSSPFLPPESGPRQLHRRFSHFANRDTAHSDGARALIVPQSRRGFSCTQSLETLPLALARRPARPDARSCRMPRQPLDAPENLPKEAGCQMALGQLEDEAPRMSNEAPAGLEEPLLETRQCFLRVLRELWPSPFTSQIENVG